MHKHYSDTKISHHGLLAGLYLRLRTSTSLADNKDSEPQAGTKRDSKLSEGATEIKDLSETSASEAESSEMGKQTGQTRKGERQYDQSPQGWFSPTTKGINYWS